MILPTWRVSRRLQEDHHKDVDERTVVIPNSEVQGRMAIVGITGL
jgi:hypothetical protein